MLPQCFFVQGSAQIHILHLVVTCLQSLLIWNGFIVSLVSGSSKFYPVDCSSICVHLDFPFVQSQAAHSHRSTTEMKSCSSQGIISGGTCLSPNDGNLDHQSKWVSVILPQLYSKCCSLFLLFLFRCSNFLDLARDRFLLGSCVLLTCTYHSLSTSLHFNQ